MVLSASISITLPISERGHARRDEIVKEFAEIDGVYIDIFRIKELTDELENRAKDAEQRIVAIAKKAGLKPVGRPDLSYGLHGGKIGPLEMWFKIQAVG